MNSFPYEEWDVVVLGCGLSGLSAGIRCAQFFKRVLILESHSVIGGLNSYYYVTGRRNIFSSGLHTVTNANAANRRWGAGLVFRNLGVNREELSLYPPKYSSKISMPGNTLHFSNDPRVLEASIQREFPSDIEGFRSFVAAIMVESEKPAPTSDDCFDLLREKIRSARLRDMLALPVLSYGGYREKSIDSRTFAVLFRSIFLEGCCCPKDIKVVLDRLLSRFQELGGHLVRRAPVATIDSADGIATGVTLSDGTRLKAGRLISSVGLHESGRLAGRNWGAPGQVSIFQWVAEYSVPVDNLGVRDTVHFSSSQNVLDWRIPRTRPFVDIATFAALDNYSFPDITNGHFKASFFSHFDEWRNLNEVEYANQKERYSTLAWQATREHYPDLAAASPTVTDAFTPTTVMRYTGHPNGSIYGGETKSFDGRSELKNLFIVGNDQGGIGIMGALTSGVIIVNYNILL